MDEQLKQSNDTEFKSAGPNLPDPRLAETVTDNKQAVLAEVHDALYNFEGEIGEIAPIGMAAEIVRLAKEKYPELADDINNIYKGLTGDHRTLDAMVKGDNTTEGLTEAQRNRLSNGVSYEDNDEYNERILETDRMAPELSPLHGNGDDDINPKADIDDSPYGL